MSRLAGCTIVAKNRLAYARVLARSFTSHNPGIPFFVLLADEVQDCFDPAAEPCNLVELPRLGLPGLASLRFRHAQQAFSYACTAPFIAWLHAQGVERVVYFKQETLVLGDVGPLFDRLRRSPIVVTPHLVTPLKGPGAVEREVTILQSGVYNVGVLGLAAHPVAARFLSWWQRRLATDCRWDVEAGLHFEQRWLDLAPGYFDGMDVLRDPAYNVGHWSLPERRIEQGPDGGFLVDGRPCRVFRFSGYRPEEPTRLTGYNTRLPWESLGAVRAIVERFRDGLEREGHGEAVHWPYAYETFDNGVPVPELARQLYRAYPGDAAAFGDPLISAGRHSFWRWLHGSEGATPLSRFWHAVWSARPDLQQAYPLLDETGAAAFMHWARQYGMAEYDVAPSFLAGRAS